MGKGRKPKPTAMLKAQGTFEPSRHKNRFEADGIPSAPTIQNANETFDWLVKKLDDLGVIAEIDGMALQMLADAWEDYQTTRAEVRQSSYQLVKVRGDVDGTGTLAAIVFPIAIALGAIVGLATKMDSARKDKG